MPEGEGRLHIALLGRFEVRAGDRVLLCRDFVPRKAAAMVKLLAMQPGRSLPRERVVDLLWPDAEAEAGANNVHKNAFHIRSQLKDAVPTPLLELRRGQVRLDDTALIDVEEFCGAAVAARTSPRRTEAYEHALRTYGGDLLPDDLYEEWTEPARQQLRALAQELRFEVAELYEADAALPAAAAHLEHVVGIDPAHEGAQRTLMRVYANMGARDRALRQYDACKQALARELDVGPTRETETLIARIRANELPLEVRSFRGAAPKEPPVRALNDTPCPEVRRVTTTDGVDIAYASLGDGPVLIEAANTPWSHITQRWDSRPLRNALERWSRHWRFVFYDGRGTGLSQRQVGDLTLEGHIRDLKAVFEASRVERGALVARSVAGPAAIAFAARYPEHVSHLILASTWARGDDYWRQGTLARGIEGLRTHWLQFTETMGLNMAGWRAGELSRHYADYLRACTEPAIAAAINADRHQIDVTPLLPQVRAKTLVIHSTHAYTSPPQFAALLVSRIPSATIAESRQPRDMYRHVDEFLMSSGYARRPASQRASAADARSA